MAFDSRGRLCGNLKIEEGSSKGRFKKHYFVLDKKDGKLKIYYDSPDRLPKTSCDPCREIRLNFISMVADARKTRPKAGFVFSLTEAGKQCYIQADNEQDMLCWIAELNEACRITVQTSEQRIMAPDATKTEIVGGIPITIAQNNSDSGEDSMEHSLPALSLPCIMSGYATKQGAVRKNWKKRFFVLDTNGFSYYKADQDKEPIKTLPLDEIIEARLVKGQHHPHRLHLLEVETSTRTFNIQCDTQADSINWTTELNRHARGLSNTPTEVSNPTEVYSKSKERQPYPQEQIKPSKVVWV